ncbi:MAG: sugar phosphate isomerase/epimerase [Bacteroidales bacterium]|nr:sugar phosphate isomerase/epimerase [Bacteroidales bacterium]
MKTTRRHFFRNMGLLGLGAAGISKTNLLHAAAEPVKLKGSVKFEIGVASYGLRGLSFEEMVEAMKMLQIKNLSLKSMHLPFELSDDEIKQRMEIMREAGLNPYAPGVVYMKSEQEVHDRFAYTKAAGMGMIVAVPNYELLDLVEEKIKETGIKIAIHTHGPDNLPYPSPEDAYERIKERDPRFGICVDLAHVLRSKLDPVQQLMLTKNRVLDVHIRDITEASKEGHSCRPGLGVFDFRASLQALIDIGYEGFVSIEYEAEKDDPVPGYAETKGYINGILAGL